MARAFWFGSDGVKHPGKTVTLDIETLQLSEDRDTAVQMLQYMLADLGEVAALNEMRKN